MTLARRTRRGVPGATRPARYDRRRPGAPKVSLVGCHWRAGRRRMWAACSGSSSDWRPWCTARSPASSAARCSRWRSPRPWSASATTTRRSSAGSGGRCPTTSTSSWRRRTSTGWRRTTRRCVQDLTQQLQEHADQQHYVFPGPITIAFESADDLSTGRFRIKSRAQAGGHEQQQRHPAAPAARADRGQRHPAPADAARPGDRPGHRGRRPDQRPGREPAAHRVPGVQPARATSRSRSATWARPTACSSTVTGSQRTAVHDGSRVKIGATTITVRVTEEPVRRGRRVRRCLS